MMHGDADGGRCFMVVRGGSVAAGRCLHGNRREVAGGDGRRRSWWLVDGSRSKDAAASEVWAAGVLVARSSRGGVAPGAWRDEEEARQLASGRLQRLGDVGLRLALDMQARRWFDESEDDAPGL